MTMEQATLPAGMQLITDRMGSVETVTLGVWVNVGARNETAEINGVSHLLEHMAFKGTARRSALDIAVEIENCLLYTSPSPRDRTRSRMPSSA